MGTIEFFPEEGKYHYDGHRACRISWHPAATKAAGGICPVCGRKVTIGVLHRVEELADRNDGARPDAAKPYESLVPLAQVIASALGTGEHSKHVNDLYNRIIREVGSELAALRRAPVGQLGEIAGPAVAEGVRRVREGKVKKIPGYDGEYGRIVVLTEEDRHRLGGQAILFSIPAAIDEPASGESVPASGTEPAPVKHVSDAGHTRRAPAFATGLQALNAGQREAVLARGGPVVVIAGPGTGKTMTLAHRIASLIRDEGISPGSITAVTFTNKAAGEMRSRVESLLGSFPDSDRLLIGTFHSICLEILSALRGTVRVVDEVDVQSILEEAIRQHGPVSVRKLRDTLRRISLLKSRGIAAGSPEVPGDFRACYGAYQRKLQEYGVLDYDDILLEALQVCETAGPGLQSLPGGFGPGRFTHLLVDEFQDLNAVQYRLVMCWARNRDNLFVIGDPDQAIYGFRGADHRFFKKLLDDFPQAHLVRLTTNYRSTPEILRAASSVISNNTDRIEMGLVPAKSAGSRISYMELPGELSEGIAIVREISNRVGGTTMLQAHGQAGYGTAGLEHFSNRSFSDFAVLVRTNGLIETIETCFLREGIPYRVVGRESFLESGAVRRVLAFLRCVLDPGDRFHMIRSSGNTPTDSGLERISRYRDYARQEPPDRLLARLAEEDGVADDDSMRRLICVATRFLTLESFISGIVMSRDGDFERPGSERLSADAVTLMTMHAAKGLECPVVFIAGFEDGLVPFKGGPGGHPGDLEEERRLFYVAVTRATDELILLRAKKRKRFGRVAESLSSPFLQEIPGDCIDFERGRYDNRRGVAGGGHGESQLRLF